MAARVMATVRLGITSKSKSRHGAAERIPRVADGSHAQRTLESEIDKGREIFAPLGWPEFCTFVQHSCTGKGIAMKRLVVITVGLAASGIGLAALQQATFKDVVRTVAVYATVTDSGGRLVPDLQRDDFQVDDNSKPQPLTVFANEVQPITVVMMLDRSVSMRRNFELVEKAAEKFVNGIRTCDRARNGRSVD